MKAVDDFLLDRVFQPVATAIDVRWGITHSKLALAAYAPWVAWNGHKLIHATDTTAQVVSGFGLLVTPLIFFNVISWGDQVLNPKRCVTAYFMMRAFWMIACVLPTVVGVLIAPTTFFDVPAIVGLLGYTFGIYFEACSRAPPAARREYEERQMKGIPEPSA